MIILGCKILLFTLDVKYFTFSSISYISFAILSQQPKNEKCSSFKSKDTSTFAQFLNIVGNNTKNI